MTEWECIERDLLRQLLSGIPQERGDACIRLGGMGSRAAFNHIVNLLLDADERVRTSAQYAISEIGLNKSDARLFIKLLAHASKDSQKLILELLLDCGIGYESPPIDFLPIIQCLASDDRDLRFLAFQWLLRKSKPLFANAADLAESCSRLTDRSSTVENLYEILLSPVATETDLSSLLLDPRTPVRCAAIIAYSWDFARWEETLLDLLRDGTEEEKCLIIEVLGERKSAKSLETLAQFAINESPDVRFYSLRSLARVGHAFEPVLAAVSRGLRDEDCSIRRMALQTLRAFGTNGATLLPDVEKLLTDSNEDVALIAVTLFQELAPKTPNSVKRLADALCVGQESVVPFWIRQLILKMVSSVLCMPDGAQLELFLKFAGSDVAKFKKAVYELLGIL